MAAFQPPTVLTGNSDGPASAFGDALTAQTETGSSDVPKRVIRCPHRGRLTLEISASPPSEDRALDKRSGSKHKFRVQPADISMLKVQPPRKGLKS